MPNRDGTGPNGQGSRTGRGMGNCKNKEKSVIVRDRKANRSRRRNIE